MIPEREAVEAAHAAICEESLEDCLDPDWRGRCVKAVEAAAPVLRAQALDRAAEAIDWIRPETGPGIKHDPISRRPQRRHYLGIGVVRAPCGDGKRRGMRLFCAALVAGSGLVLIFWARWDAAYLMLLTAIVLDPRGRGGE